MNEITININKRDVYEEVSQTTSYTGAKLADSDPKAYDRMMTTEADKGQLDRFWNESCVAVCEKLKKHLADERRSEGGLELRMSLSSGFDENLVQSMRDELFSFFVMNITAKWYVFTNKGEAQKYSAEAAVMLEGVNRKACYKKRPKRPTYGN